MAENQKKNQNNPKPKNPMSGKVMYIIYTVIILTLGVMLLSGDNSSAPKMINWEKLEPILLNEDYEKIVVVNQEYAEVYISEEALKEEKYQELYGKTFTGQKTPKASHYRYNIGNFEHFDKELAIVEEQTGKHISYDIIKKSNAWRDILFFLGPVILIIVFMIVINRMSMRQMGGGSGGGGIFGVGKSKAKM